MLILKGKIKKNTFIPLFWAKYAQHEICHVNHLFLFSVDQ